MRIVPGALLCMVPIVGCMVVGCMVAGCVVVDDKGANAPTTPVVTAPPPPRSPDTTPDTPPPGDGPSTDTPGDTPGDAPGDAPFSISLERTACFGACPMYTVTVDGSGAVTFDGKRFVASAGTHSARVDTEAVSRLRQAVEASDFFALQDCYCERNVTDLPSAIVTVTLGDRKKTVRHYAGDRSAPPVLIDLQDRIDELARTERWIKPRVE